MCCVISFLVVLLVVLYFCSLKKCKMVVLSVFVIEIGLLKFTFTDNNMINRIIFLTLFFILLLCLINYYFSNSDLIADISKLIFVLIAFFITMSLITNIVKILSSNNLIFRTSKYDEFERYSIAMLIVNFFMYWIIKIIKTIINIVLERIKNKFSNNQDNMYYQLIFNDKVITKSIEIGYIVFLIMFYINFTVLSSFIGDDGTIINNNVIYKLLDINFRVPENSNLTNSIVLSLIFNIELLFFGLQNYLSFKEGD